MEKVPDNKFPKNRKDYENRNLAKRIKKLLEVTKTNWILLFTLSYYLLYYIIYCDSKLLLQNTLNATTAHKILMCESIKLFIWLSEEV